MDNKNLYRNDKCLCGSGKKYKKCCIDITSTNSEKTTTSHPISKFNRTFLIDVISNAFCIPQNHGKNIRLELLMRESLIHGQISGGSRDLQELKTILDENYAYHHLEDPREYLFSDRISFFGGEYIVLPGIFTNGHFVLSNLLMSLFSTKHNLPQKTTTWVYFNSILALNISNTIAKNHGIGRYESGIPNDVLLEISISGSSNTFISDQLIREWCENFNISPLAMANFLLDRETQLNEEDPDKNPVALKPIIKVNGGFVVLSPTNLIGSLLHSIFVHLVEDNILESVLEIYLDRLWHFSVEYHLRKMGASPIQVDFITPPEWTKFGAYKIDTDKVMIFIMNQDNGEDYNTENLYTSYKIVDSDEDFITETIESLKIFFKDHEFLIVHLTSGIGRAFGVNYKGLDQVSIGMSVADFEYMMRLREYDPLELWNYAKAKSRFAEKTRFSPTIDELDIYAFYLEKDHSFYLGDETRPDYLMVSPGTSLDIRERICIDEDIHSIPYINDEGVKGLITCVNYEGFERVYAPIDPGHLHQVVLGDSFPVWVQFGGDVFSIPVENRGVYINFLEALCYWVWQFIESLEPHLSILEEYLILIKFDFRDRNKFENLIPSKERVQNLEKEFSVELNGNTINLTIPESLITYLNSKDNEGERILLLVLLDAFGQMQELKGAERTLNTVEIEKLIDIHAPLGIKKKIFLIDNEASDMCLTPIGRREPRYVQAYNVNYVLDELVPRAIEAGIIDGKPKSISNSSKQDKFLKRLIFDVLVPWLNSELAELDSIALLKHLYDQSEMLVFTSRMNHFTLPTSIACFQNYDEQVKKLMDKDQSIAHANISVRCLIEHIAALPVHGGKIPSQSAIDNLLAIMDQIFAWGSVDDSVVFGLYDSTIDILHSQRIGTDHSIESKVMAPFRVSKAKEIISDSHENFERAYENKDDSPNEPSVELNELNQAFNSDYGFTFTRLMEFGNVLIGLAYHTDLHCDMEESELIDHIGRELNDSSVLEINKMITYFSLEEREDFMTPPQGFEPFDLSPWRFNRGISLLRKPIVKVKANGKVHYIWGCRQVELASQQLVLLIQSGKIKCPKGSALAEIKGRMLIKKGERFNKTVLEFYKSHENNYFVDTEIFIKNEKGEDIGDIDVLIIDKENCNIHLVECKNTSVAKTMKQLVEEIEHLFGSDKKKSWLTKHETRLNYIRENLSFLENKYNLELGNFSIYAAILTSEQLPTKYLMESDLPFAMASFYEVKESIDPCSVLIKSMR